jgi:hypothetical protein
MHVPRTLEMSITREEFFRLLPAAVGSFVVSGDDVRPSGGNHGWVIRLVPLPDHRVGSIDVPRHQVDIVFEGCAESEAEAFMDRFHRAFLRGGG